MAEIVGVVASGISIGTLAAQITTSLIKLKSYWDQVRDAPEDIRDLIEGLEILAYTLAAAEDDQRLNPISSSIVGPTSMCLNRCKKAAERLKDLADKIRADIEAGNRFRRKWGSTKVVLKKDQIDKYRAELGSTIALMSLSQQLYTTALIRMQYDLVAKQLSQPSPESTAIMPENASSENNKLSSYVSRPWTLPNLLGAVYYKRRRYLAKKTIGSDKFEKREDIIAMYRGPAWLINRAWQIQASKAMCGWNISLRTSNVIRRSSPVFDLASNGDIEGLQALFSNGKASPFDCDETGWTILHSAAWNHKFSMCKLLVDQGADADTQTLDRPILTTPLQIASYTLDCDENGFNEAVDLLRFLWGKTRTIPNMYEFGFSSKEAFDLYRQNVDPYYYERPLLERVENALDLPLFTPPSVLKAVVAGDEIPNQAILMTNTHGKTLLHMVAWNIRYQARCYNPDRGWLIAKSRRESSLLIEELVTKGAELHHISLTSRTPLLELLPPFLCCLQEREYLSIPQFDHWLQDLAECGVDLEEYGRTETYLHEREHVDWTIEGDFTIQDGSEVEILWTMKELYYGQSPRNWGFYMEADIYTSDEGLEHDMPGAWIDEESMSQEGQRGIEDDDLARRAEDEEDESADIIEDGRNSEQSSDEGESVDGEFDSNGVWEENQNPGVKDLHDEKNIVRTEIIDKSPVGLSPGAGEYIYVFPCDPLDLTKYKKIIIRH